MKWCTPSGERGRIGAMSTHPPGGVRGDAPQVTPSELMKQRNSLMHSEESIANGRGFTPSADDVFIVTYPKCGTTWMTQVCHQIRTTRLGRRLRRESRSEQTDTVGDELPPDGSVIDPTELDEHVSMGFGEITEIVPWDILAKDCGQDLGEEQVISSPGLGKCVLKPRLFKSHETCGKIAGGAKYVCVVRNPLDVFNSFYEFLPPYMGIDVHSISKEEFCDAIFAGASHSGQVWEHFLGWWRMGIDDDTEKSGSIFHNPNCATKTTPDDSKNKKILITSFEDMKTDLATVVRRVGAFMKTNNDDDLSEHDVASIVRVSSYDFMRRNAEKFDDHFVRRKMWSRVGIPESDWAEGGVGKVREGGGRVGGGVNLPESVRKRIEMKWDQVMKPSGFETYEEFRKATEERNAKCFDS